MQEEPDPPAGLVPDPGTLVLALGAGEQQAGALAFGTGLHDDPAGAVRPGLVRGQPESEGLGVEADGLVVVVDDEGDQGNAAHRGLPVRLVSG